MPAFSLHRNSLVVKCARKATLQLTEQRLFNLDDHDAAGGDGKEPSEGRIRRGAPLGPSGLAQPVGRGSLVPLSRRHQPAAGSLIERRLQRPARAKGKAIGARTAKNTAKRSGKSLCTARTPARGTAAETRRNLSTTTPPTVREERPCDVRPVRYAAPLRSPPAARKEWAPICGDGCLLGPEELSPQ
ncbi:hypothetical protein HPB50_005528 [Hyalomma asiaticum]|uniref:Uncharacterized protein n=1 Tax=Hyalomma asiaticum TaxID=266040 RepID=A0ACB7TF17_HYAAI|nr:hypothetical protein HPB50_005528 [Hyalomma asiaticum]